MSESAMQSKRAIAGSVPIEGRIYPIPVKPPSGIVSWRGWPDDVRDTLLRWNAGKGLSFHTWDGVFRCEDCAEFCLQRLTARMRGALVCDDCLIARARAAALSRTPRRNTVANDNEKENTNALPTG